MTHLDSGRVLWPSISADGRTIAIERDFGIATVDTATGAVRPLAITLVGAPPAAGEEYRTFTKGFDELALAPDGKKVAFVVHGEVFATSASDGGEATRVTHTPEPEANLAWAPDSRRLIYASARDGAWRLYLYDFRGDTERRLTSDPAGDLHPTFSPDGKQVAFLRGSHELRVLDLATGKERLLATAGIDLAIPLQSTRPFVWSPDGRWLAFMSNGARMFRNASVVRADGSAPPATVSFLANVGNDTVSWSPDGKSLFFDTGQRTESAQIARVDLVPQAPKFREQQFRDLFEEETPESVPPAERETKAQREEAESRAGKGGEAAEKGKPEKPAAPVEVDVEQIRRRLRLLPIDLDVAAQTISPDGKQLLLVARSAGKQALYVYPLDPLAKEPAVPKQLVAVDGDLAQAQFSADGKQIAYLLDGKIVLLPAAGGDAKPLAVSGGMSVDFARERDISFDEAWGWMRDFFHDPAMNGADWQAVREELAPRVAAARNPDELHRLLSLMIGELDASHLGSRSGGRPERTDRSARAALRPGRARAGGAVSRARR